MTSAGGTTPVDNSSSDRDCVTSENASARVRLVFAIAGLVLLVAAVLKTASGVPTPWLSIFGRGAHVLHAALIGFELSLGVYLLLFIRPPLSRRIAMLTFAAFAIYSAGAFVTGVKSCGCFGSITVSPAAMFLIDGAVLVAMWRARID